MGETLDQNIAGNNGLPSSWKQHQLKHIQEQHATFQRPSRGGSPKGGKAGTAAVTPQVFIKDKYLN
jgi:hypothetical protein